MSTIVHCLNTGSCGRVTELQVSEVWGLRSVSLAHIAFKFLETPFLEGTLVKRITKQNILGWVDFYRISPIGRFSHRVAMFVCLFVCMSVCDVKKIHFFGGQGDFLSKGVSLILTPGGRR